MLHRGSPSGPETDGLELEPQVDYVANVSAVGDIDFDGFDDFVVGEPYHGLGASHGDTTGTGRLILYGGRSGRPKGIAYAPVDPEGSQLGDLVLGGGDQDGDRVPDVVVAAGFSVSDHGAVYRFHGLRCPLSLP
jgi:hypothetical protein